LTDADDYCSDAKELVAELEFVWDQIKNNSPVNSSGRSSSASPLAQHSQPRDDGMRVLSPMSQDDEAERDSQRRIFGPDEEDEAPEPRGDKGKWRKSVELALVKMTAEMAALREQIATGREYRGQRRQTLGAWASWLVWIAFRHFVTDIVLVGLILLLLRRKKNRKLEDLIREWLRDARAYVRKFLPAR
jgi:hypothetical protein